MVSFSSLALYGHLTYVDIYALHGHLMPTGVRKQLWLPWDWS